MKKELLKAEHIFKNYYLGEIELEILRDVSLSIKAGEFLSILGKSGSGKTTLMNILGCLDVPSKGKYLIEGENVADLTPDELAHIRNKKIGFVFQQFNLLPDLTALDNVALPQLYAGVRRNEAREHAKKLLQLVDLADRLDHFPNQLSGGQQQRVSIARALSNSPSIILADEPTGNLDSKTGDHIVELFKQLNSKSNITIIIVTHDDNLAEVTDRIITLRDGKIASDKMCKNCKAKI